MTSNMDFTNEDIRKYQSEEYDKWFEAEEKNFPPMLVGQPLVKEMVRAFGKLSYCQGFSESGKFLLKSFTK